MLIVIQIVGSLLTIVVAGLAASWGAYAKKKGENLATKEDFNDLKNQTAELTKTTREIEAKIGDQVWNRQRRWKLKRDSVIDVIRALSATEDALMEVSAVYQLRLKFLSTPKTDADYEQAVFGWKDRITTFEGKRAFTKLTCSDEFNAALKTARDAIRIGMKQMLNREIQSYDEIGPFVSPAVHEVIAKARMELGLGDDDVIPA